MAEYFKGQGKQVHFLGNALSRNFMESESQRVFDEMHFFDRKAISAFGFKRFRLILWMKRQRFHTVIYPVYSREYKQGDRIVFLSRALVRVGFRGDHTSISPGDKIRSDRYYSQLIETEIEHLFEFERNRFFAQRLTGLDLTNLRPALPFIQRTESSIRASIGIFLGGQERKRLWGKDRFHDLIDLVLKNTALSVEILGGRDCKMAGEHLDRAFHSNPRVLNLVGKTTVGELAQRIAGAQILVTHDSSAYHIAVAVGCPVVCISNGNHWGRFVPYPSDLLRASQTVITPPGMDLHDRSFYYNSRLSIQTITASQVFEALMRTLQQDQ